MLLAKIATDLWIYEGETVSFYGYPYTTRMTVVRLTENSLWIHSPEKLTKQLQAELATIGEVRYLVSPNHLHHLFLPEWIAAYPQARNYAAPGLKKKRPDIHFDKELADHAETEWSKDIDQLIFRGSFAMQEVIFFHRPSRTLILTDLIENFPQDHFQGWQKHIAKFAGILAPDGKAPIDFRLSFLFGKPKARAARDRMFDWQPQNIILSHGQCIFGEGEKYMRKAFAWV